jgi:hypothetical protein
VTAFPGIPGAYKANNIWKIKKKYLIFLKGDVTASKNMLFIPNKIFFFFLRLIAIHCFLSSDNNAPL